MLELEPPGQEHSGHKKDRRDPVNPPQAWAQEGLPGIRRDPLAGWGEGVYARNLKAAEVSTGGQSHYQEGQGHGQENGPSIKPEGKYRNKTESMHSYPR